MGELKAVLARGTTLVGSILKQVHRRRKKSLSESEVTCRMKCRGGDGQSRSVLHSDCPHHLPAELVPGI